MKIRIYQINLGRDHKRVAFQGLDALEKFNGSKELDSEIYDCVFSGEVDCKGLENVFQKFNNDRPEGYKGRSLSVSDVVEIIEAKDVEPSFYFCDYVGFKKVEFDPEEAEPLFLIPDSQFLVSELVLQRRLDAVDLLIQALLPDQLLVGALLGDPAVLQPDAKIPIPMLAEKCRHLGRKQGISRSHHGKYPYNAQYQSK